MDLSVAPPRSSIKHRSDRPGAMDDPEHPHPRRRSQGRRSIPSTATGRAGLVLVALLLAGLVVYAALAPEPRPRRARPDHRDPRLDRARAGADGTLAAAALGLLARGAARRPARHTGRLDAGSPRHDDRRDGLRGVPWAHRRAHSDRRALAPPGRAPAAAAADRDGDGVLTDADQPARARDPRIGHVRQHSGARTVRGDPRGRRRPAGAVCAGAARTRSAAPRPTLALAASAPRRGGDRAPAAGWPGKDWRCS